VTQKIYAAVHPVGSVGALDLDGAPANPSPLQVGRPLSKQASKQASQRRLEKKVYSAQRTSRVRAQDQRRHVSISSASPAQAQVAKGPARCFACTWVVEPLPQLQGKIVLASSPRALAS
jgi:hypothetical protein